MTDAEPKAVVLDFKAERNRRKNDKKPKDEKYKPDFKKFQTYLNKSDTDKTK